MATKISILTKILLEMEVGQVYKKDSLMKMVNPSALIIKDENLNYYERRAFDVQLCEAKSRIKNAKYKTNVNKQVTRIL
mgnify:CR=1 FL=1